MLLKVDQARKILSARHLSIMYGDIMCMTTIAQGLGGGKWECSSIGFFDHSNIALRQ